MVLKRYCEQFQEINRFVWKASIYACINSALLGYDIGVMGGAMIFITEEMNLSVEETEVVLGSLNAVAIIGTHH